MQNIHAWSQVLESIIGISAADTVVREGASSGHLSETSHHISETSQHISETSQLMKDAEKQISLHREEKETFSKARVNILSEHLKKNSCFEQKLAEKYAFLLDP